MTRHLNLNPNGATASGTVPGAVPATSVYDLAPLLDQPMDVRSGATPIVEAVLTVDGSAVSGLSVISGGIQTLADVSNLAAFEIAAVSGNGYQIAVGTGVGARDSLELEYNERGMVERPL